MGIFIKNNKNDIGENYNKLTDNLYINYDEKKVIIENNVFNFSDILGVKLVENGTENIIGTKLPSAYSYVGVGTNTKLINKLNVEIKTNDIRRPFFSVPFLKTIIGVDKNSRKYKKAYEQAQKSVSILEIIIKNNEQK